MLSEVKNANLKEIIQTCWQGEQVSEDDFDEIEYELYNGISDACDSLFFDTENGSISMGRHFQYDDDPEYPPSINEEEYWRENAFSEFLEKHSDHRICSWHDLCYDLGYPGTDYERFVGFRDVDCTESIIHEYLQLIELHDKTIVTLKDAIEYLYHSYLKYTDTYRFTYSFDSNNIDESNLEELVVSFKGEEYFFCKTITTGQVYICDLHAYLQLEKLFNDCTYQYKKGILDGFLWFVSSDFSVRVELMVADISYLEIEQYFLNAKLQRSILAMDQLYGDNAPRKTEEEIQEEIALTKSIATACIKLIQHPLLYNNQSENIRNDSLRDLLSMAGYDVKDQTRTGYSSSGISTGEADLLIKKSDIPYAFIESLNLKGVNKPYINEHIDRIYKYDRTGTPVNFLVCYVNVKNPVDFFHGYLKCITEKLNSMRPIDFQWDVKNILESPAANIKIIKMSFVRNRMITTLYHILAYFDA